MPLEDQLGALVELRDEGKIRHLGLSEVTSPQIEAARRIAPIVTVQNLYNLADRSAEDVLDDCEREGIAFIPWFPLATGDLAAPAARSARSPREHGATPVAARARLAAAPLAGDAADPRHRRRSRTSRRTSPPRGSS